jgi:hypothetical protein
VVRRVIRERIKSVSEKEKRERVQLEEKRRERKKSERTLRTKNAAVGFQKNNLR